MARELGVDFGDADDRMGYLATMFQEKIGKMDTYPFGKQEVTALELRNKGNELFASKSYAEAIEQYTEVSHNYLMSPSILVGLSPVEMVLTNIHYHRAAFTVH